MGFQLMARTGIEPRTSDSTAGVLTTRSSCFPKMNFKGTSGGKQWALQVTAISFKSVGGWGREMTT